MYVRSAAVLFSILFLTSAAAPHAAEVVAQRPDNLSGQMLGGWTAVLLGGAAGGPAGAIAGGLLGAWLGGEVQQVMGASGDAYLIKTDDGEVQRLRSPEHQFEVGDTVAIRGTRPEPVAVTNQ